MTKQQCNLAQVIAQLESWYPRHTAEAWDSVGLIAGDPSAPVRRVLFALDPVRDTVEQAVSTDADLLVTHHPLFLKPVHQVAATNYKGALVHRLISSGVALYNAHTNADVAANGVAEALAELVGLEHLEPLVPAQSTALDKFVVFVPPAQSRAVQQAMSDAGAGNIGEYSGCSWQSTGTGQFTPSDEADPAVGSANERTEVTETRLEMVAPRSARNAVARAMRTAHPYEEPAFDVFEQATLPASTGLGRIGTLPQPLTLREFAAQVAAVLPATAQGIRFAGDPDGLVQQVAVLGGSGDSLFDAVRAAGVDAYVTSDLRHHPASEAREAALFAAGEQATPYLVDTAHFASEWPWLTKAAAALEQWAAEEGIDLEVQVSQISSDPWTGHVPSPKQ